MTAISAWSSESSTERFRVFGKSREFVKEQDKKLLISEDCRKSEGEFACDAFKALARASLAKVTKRLRRGINPGGVICREIGGELAMGLSEQGDENLFCQFADNSLVSAGSLHAHGILNDESSSKGGR